VVNAGVLRTVSLDQSIERALGPAPIAPLAQQMTTHQQLKMTTLQEPQPEDRTGEAWRARLAVRIPRNDGTDLLADATRRLETAQFEGVELLELRGVQPTLSATIARLDVRLTAGPEHDRAAIQQRLEETPGIEAIDSIEREAKVDGNEDGEPAEYG
jgi:hypothetical protein